MSLINDALKRAKQVQQQGQPAPNLQFRPVEPAQHRKPRYDWVVPAMVAVVGILAFAFFWPWAKNRDSNHLTQSSAQDVVAAKEISPPVVPPPPAPAQAAVPNPASNSAPVAAADTKAVASAEPPAPKLPPLRLQAIVYSPTRPSAMIGGRTLHIGDKVSGMRLVAIDQESATLVGMGQTNVLMLDQ